MPDDKHSVTSVAPMCTYILYFPPIYLTNGAMHNECMRCVAHGVIANGHIIELDCPRQLRITYAKD